LSKPHVIAFVGTVGSGKSTQMRLLASDLRRRRVKVRVSYLKTGHIFAYFLEVILARMFAGKRRDVYPIRALLEEKPRFFSRIFRLWLALDVISVALKFLFSIYLPLKLGYIILVEEYIPASISDYIYLSKIARFTLRAQSFVITFLLKLMRLGDFTQIFFLDAENSVLKCRWKRRGGFDERNDYLDMQRALLLSISRRLSSNKLLYIDVSKQTVEETHQLIKKQLMSEVE